MHLYSYTLLWISGSFNHLNIFDENAYSQFHSPLIFDENAYSQFHSPLTSVFALPNFKPRISVCITKKFLTTVSISR